jgi:plastocyanin
MLYLGSNLSSLMLRKKILIGAMILLLVLVAIVIFAKISSTGNQDLSSQSGAQVMPQVTAPSVGQTVNLATSVDQAPSTTSSVMSPVAVATQQAANLSAMPGAPDGPKQVTIKADQIPAQAIKLQVSASGFSPKEFQVKSGDSVTLAISGADSNPHVFIFPDSSFLALTTMVLGGETKTLTFIAPKAGTYSFRDDLPSFRNNTGKMIVN